MQLFSLRKSDVPLRNSKLSAECLETPTLLRTPSPTLVLFCQTDAASILCFSGKIQELFTPSPVSAIQLAQGMLYHTIA